MLENDFGSEVICHHFENDAAAAPTVVVVSAFVEIFY